MLTEVQAFLLLCCKAPVWHNLTPTLCNVRAMGSGRPRGQYQELRQLNWNRASVFTLIPVEVKLIGTQSTQHNSFPWKASGVNTSTAALAVYCPQNNILPFSLSVCSKNPNLAGCSVPPERPHKLQHQVEVIKQNIFFVRRYPEYTAYHHYLTFETGVTWWESVRKRSGCYQSSSVLVQQWQEKSRTDVTLGRYPEWLCDSEEAGLSRAKRRL